MSNKTYISVAALVLAAVALVAVYSRAPIQIDTDQIVKQVLEQIQKFGADITNFSGLGLSTSNQDDPYEQIVTDGVCADATTTLFSVVNPFSATSTVTLVTVDITGRGTTSGRISVGTSTSAVHATTTMATSRAALIREVFVGSASSTYGYQKISNTSSSTYMSSVDGAGISSTSPLNGFLIASSTDITDGRLATSSNVVFPSAVVRPNERVAGVWDDARVSSSTKPGGGGELGGVIGGNNLFKCTYKILWTK